ncbi:hypothetical protein BKA69DRAFT_725224 [Paraphysoderma sedebokerense]|nr:hypothetical protein BKA69DRAFT_725224 [Paraphysoderma sedebokerense]
MTTLATLATPTKPPRLVAASPIHAASVEYHHQSKMQPLCFTEPHRRPPKRTHSPVFFESLPSSKKLHMESQQTNPTKSARKSNLNPLRSPASLLLKFRAQNQVNQTKTSIESDFYTEGRDRTIVKEAVDSAFETGNSAVDLSGKRLSNLSADIRDLSKLVRIDSSYSEASRFQDSIQLFLSNNLLNRLPIEMFCLQNLTMLSLRNNRIEYLPPEIGLLTNLVELNLGGNLLRYLPFEISYLHKLRILVCHPCHTLHPPRPSAVIQKASLSTSAPPSLVTLSAREIIKDSSLLQRITCTPSVLSSTVVPYNLYNVFETFKLFPIPNVKTPPGSIDNNSVLLTNRTVTGDWKPRGRHPNVCSRPMCANPIIDLTAVKIVTWMPKSKLITRSSSSRESETGTETVAAGSVNTDTEDDLDWNMNDEAGNGRYLEIVPVCRRFCGIECASKLQRQVKPKC